jgi:hypothetical protein
MELAINIDYPHMTTPLFGPDFREGRISDIFGVAEANARAMLAYRSAGTLPPLNGRYGPKG